MAAIWNVNSVYNPDLKKFSGKISFDIGQVFLARVIKLGDNNNEVLLRLLDGWQFPAELLNENSISTDKPIKFQVDGFKDGKLQIKVVNQKEDDLKNNDSSIETVLMDQNIELGKEEYDILESMVKHSMPLTKDNISKVKTYIDMDVKVASSKEGQDNFITKYLSSKNIDINSPKGKEIVGTLKSFFNELKNVNAEDIMTMMENGLEINQENIKSYNKVFKEPGGIYKQIKNLQGQIEVSFGKNEIKQIIDNFPKDNIEGTNTNIENDKNVKVNDNNKGANIIENINNHNNEVIIKKDKVVNSSNDNNSVDGSSNEDNSINELNKNENSTEKQVVNSKIENGIKNNVEKNSNKSIETNVLDSKNMQVKNEEIFKDIKSKGIEKGVEWEVKSQLNIKTEEVKSIIKSVLQISNEKSPELSDKIFQIIKQDISDFKAFNSVSNQYYYMDLPVKVDNRNYDCKLIIKDERKKGKKIDTKDVKIAASVNTINMGVINAYIKVSNINMNVNINCDERWLKTINNDKDNLLKNLSDLGYNVNIEVDKKEQDLALSNCSSFFEDSNFSGLNIRA